MCLCVHSFFIFHCEYFKNFLDFVDFYLSYSPISYLIYKYRDIRKVLLHENLLKVKVIFVKRLYIHD